jgi:hypothetical protein
MQYPQKLNSDLSSQEYESLKKLAAFRRTSVSQLVTDALREFVQSELKEAAALANGVIKATPKVRKSTAKPRRQTKRWRAGRKATETTPGGKRRKALSEQDVREAEAWLQAHPDRPLTDLAAILDVSPTACSRIKCGQHPVQVRRTQAALEAATRRNSVDRR